MHLDGARFANAMVALGCSAAEMTLEGGRRRRLVRRDEEWLPRLRGRVFFDKTLAEDFQYRRKRSGHTVSKGRLLGAQLAGYLADGHWLANARHANAMAQRLSRGLAGLPGARLAWPTQANEVFVVFSAAAGSRGQGGGLQAARPGRA